MNTNNHNNALRFCSNKSRLMVVQEMKRVLLCGKKKRVEFVVNVYTHIYIRKEKRQRER